MKAAILSSKPIDFANEASLLLKDIMAYDLPAAPEYKPDAAPTGAEAPMDDEPAVKAEAFEPEDEEAVPDQFA